MYPSRLFAASSQPHHLWRHISPMESHKPPKRPTLRWDQYKRQVLCCLFRFFVCDKKQFQEIFSYIFRDHLNERGIHGFISFQTLNTQWVWMRNSGNLDWFHVHIGTAFETNRDWREIISKVNSAAETLRFHLREKTVDNIDTSRWKSGDGNPERAISSVRYYLNPLLGCPN